MGAEKEIVLRVQKLTKEFRIVMLDFFSKKESDCQTVILVLCELIMEFANYQVVHSGINPELYRQAILHFVNNFEFMDLSLAEKDRQNLKKFKDAIKN